MSWRERGIVGPAVVLVGALALGGCLRPVYADRGPSSAALSSGVPSSVADQLAAIDVLPIDGRVGQQIQNNLRFALTGGSDGLPPRYKLDVGVSVASDTSPVVDPFTDRAELDTVNVDAAFTLVEVGTGTPVTTGNAFGRATYSVTRQRFANVRAARDAEDRAGRIVTEQIRARLLSYFSSRR